MTDNCMFCRYRQIVEGEATCTLPPYYYCKEREDG